MQFSTVALFGRYQDSGMDGPLRDLAQMILNNGLNVMIEKGTAESTCVREFPIATIEEIGAAADLGIVMGGDGTMLGVTRLLAQYDIPLVGINYGRLGFITDIPVHNAAASIALILDGQFEKEERRLLQGTILREGQVLTEALALNDVVLNRTGRGGMIEIQVSYNQSLMYQQRSDGLIVSTPTGSTAYSLSANGPILHPSLSAFLLVPIAPQTLSNRPIVVPDDGELTLTLKEISRSGQGANVHFDMQSWTDVQTGDQVVVKKALHCMTFLHPKGYSYFSTLRKKLHWNIMPEITDVPDRIE